MNFCSILCIIRKMIYLNLTCRIFISKLNVRVGKMDFQILYSQSWQLEKPSLTSYLH